MTLAAGAAVQAFKDLTSHRVCQTSFWCRLEGVPSLLVWWRVPSAGSDTVPFWLVLIENQHYLLTLCYARRTACESSPIRDRPTCLAGPRPWAGQAARRVRNVATLQWEPSAMGHLGINVHARALAMECSNRGQVIWLAMMGKRAQVQPHEPGE